MDRNANVPVDSMPPLITLHSQHLHTLISLCDILSSPETDFDLGKLTLERWRDLATGGERWEGVREWEELVDLEITFGGSIGGDDVEEDVPTPSGKGKKKGKR